MRIFFMALTLTINFNRNNSDALLVVAASSNLILALRALLHFPLSSILMCKSLQMKRITLIVYLLAPPPCPLSADEGPCATRAMLTRAKCHANPRQIEIRVIDSLQTFLYSTVSRCVCRFHSWMACKGERERTK